ncbi:trihelix transcription factor ASIL1 isoform X1 [Morus notabilis]|uniref:trihelix transcription factor ASIL1 isoform X1 n=1 Tax=Morus notabilis TaxID=981085 RepID=UPI000CED11BA|nr:trihelix transcription factor ASIL1 isoform X1 [Morus notabilis]
MDSDTGTPSPAKAPLARTTPFSGREDCWSADATFTLIDAWGERYLELKRGNLRQKHWQEVADAVNSDHCDGPKSRRTDIQCKNRIDTLKKKYKIEKARVSDSDGTYVSPWPFFARLDALIGATFPVAKKLSPLLATAAGGYRNPSPPSWARYSPVPVGPRSATLKRPAPPAPFAVDYEGSARNFSAFAAAAVAALAEEEAEDEESDRSGSRSSMKSRGRDEREREPMYRELAKAIERFGEIYQRVEVAKQRQMVELEKQRMQFAKDLEFQRMQLFMETQVQLQKIKRAKRSPGAVTLSFAVE